MGSRLLQLREDAIAIVLIVTFIQEETGTILILICHQNYLRTI